MHPAADMLPQRVHRDPGAKTPARKRRLPGAHGYTLRLYCEEPGAWHPLPGEQGCYPVTKLDDWLTRLASPLNKVLTVLQHATPLAGPILGIAAAELHGKHIRFHHVTETITARMPAPDESRLLQISGITPVLCLWVVGRDAATRALEVAEAILPGNRHELEDTYLLA